MAKKIFYGVVIAILIIALIFSAIFVFIKYVGNKTGNLEKYLADYENENFFCIANDYFFSASNGVSSESLSDSISFYDENWEILYMTNECIFFEKGKNEICKVDYKFENIETIFKKDFSRAKFLDENTLIYNYDGKNFWYDFLKSETIEVDDEYESLYSETYNKYDITYNENIADKLVNREIQGVTITNKETNESKNISEDYICENNELANYLREEYEMYWKEVIVRGDNIYFIIDSFELRIAFKYNFENEEITYYSYVDSADVLETEMYFFKDNK